MATGSVKHSVTSRSEESSPSYDQQSTQVFENLAKKLHRLESKLGELDTVQICSCPVIDSKLGL